MAFNMPLFVMLSGYSNFNAFNRIVDKQGLWNFIKKSTIRILLPVVTFCVIGMTPNFLLSPFWFLNMILYLMLGFSVIHFVVYALHKQHLFGVSLLIFVLAFIGLNVLWIGEMCTYYAVGLLCKRYGVFDRPRRFLFPVILFVEIGLNFPKVSAKLESVTTGYGVVNEAAYVFEFWLLILNLATFTYVS